MRHALGSGLLKASSLLEDGALAKLLRSSVGARRVALCFHRVAEERRAGELQPKLTMAPEEIDRLISFVHAAVGPLTVSFDDGYLDSAQYVLSRADRFPQVEWLYFVCPQKTERQSGFRWDLAERTPGQDAQTILAAPVDVAAENLRADLRALCGDAAFRLAGVELCRRIQRLPNAALGNHTNVHHRPSELTCAQAVAEFAGSTLDFERLFGPTQHFAFPFGVPGADFTPRDLAILRQLGTFILWSTEPRPFDARERRPGAVLPRFAVDGTRTWKETALQIAVHALRTRLPGTEHRTSP